MSLSTNDQFIISLLKLKLHGTYNKHWCTFIIHLCIYTYIASHILTGAISKDKRGSKV